MAIRNKVGNDGLEKPSSTMRKGPARKSKLVALTVKVDGEVYVRLCTLGATQRRTNQDILHEALRAYLERAGA